MPAMTRGMEDYGRYGLGANADSVSVMRLEEEGQLERRGRGYIYKTVLCPCIRLLGSLALNIN